MANTLFPLAKEGFLAGEIDLDTAVIKVGLVRGYTYDATDKFVSDMASATFQGTAQTLGTKTIALGVFDAADSTFSAVASNASNHYLLVYQASAVTGGADVATSAQRVIAYIDTGTNLPVVPNGGDVVITWDNGASKIFAL